MLFRQIFEPKLAQYAYLVGCQQTGEALIIDPERDIDRYTEIAEAEGLAIVAVAETHIHADFLSGAREFAERFDTLIYLSDEGGDDWKYDWARSTAEKGMAYDVVFLTDGHTFSVGQIEVEAVHTPGHTPEHLSFLVTDRGGGATSPVGIATGDFVFVGDLGRPDLLEQAAGMHGVQESSARRLFGSLPRFTELEEHLQVWPAHGAGSTCGKSLGAVPTSTVGYEKRYNASLNAAMEGEQAFVRAILEGQPEPQTYFARMKRDNKQGPPLLGGLPQPRKLTAGELAETADDDRTLIIDARRDRSAFMDRHIPRSLYAPLNKSFNTVVGSLVVDETTPIVLIADEEDVEEAVRDLIRVGYDNVVAFVDTATLHRHFAQGGRAASIREIGFDDVASLRRTSDIQPLDVRYASEYDEGHVPDAINASYTRLPDYVKGRVPRDRSLMVYCGTGVRSAAASAFLARAGYDVTYVNGDISDYAKKEDLERRETEPA